MSALHLVAGIAIGVAGTLAVQSAISMPFSAQGIENALSFATPDGRLLKRAKEAVSPMLIDPYSAKFEGLWKVDSHFGPAVCGFVNAKNRMGAYVGRSKFVFIDTMGTALLEQEAGSLAKDPFMRVCDPAYLRPSPAQGSISPQQPKAEPERLKIETEITSYFVQLLAQSSEANAKKAWGTLRTRHNAILGTATPIIKREKSEDPAMPFRVLIGPYLESDARSMCSALQSRKQNCAVVSE